MAVARHQRPQYAFANATVGHSEGRRRPDLEDRFQYRAAGDDQVGAVPTEAMQKISTMIAGMDFEERSRLPCIGRDRADLVVAGCAILEAIIEIWPAKNLGVADRGIREGILRSLMARDGWQL